MELVEPRREPRAEVEAGALRGRGQQPSLDGPGHPVDALDGDDDHGARRQQQCRHGQRHSAQHEPGARRRQGGVGQPVVERRHGMRLRRVLERLHERLAIALAVGHRSRRRPHLEPGREGVGVQEEHERRRDERRLHAEGEVQAPGDGGRAARAALERVRGVEERGGAHDQREEHRHVLQQLDGHPDHVEHDALGPIGHGDAAESAEQEEAEAAEHDAQDGVGLEAAGELGGERGRRLRRVGRAAQAVGVVPEGEDRAEARERRVALARRPRGGGG